MCEAYIDIWAGIRKRNMYSLLLQDLSLTSIWKWEADILSSNCPLTFSRITEPKKTCNSLYFLVLKIYYV